MAEQKTFGDILFAGFTAAGVPVDSEKLKKLLEDDHMKTPVSGENAFEKFFEHFMTFQQALENPGIKQKISGEIKDSHGKEVYGGVVQRSERELVKFLNEIGQETDSFKELFKTHSELKDRWPVMYKRILDMGKRIGSNDANPDEALKAEMDRLKSELTAQANGAKTDMEEYKAKYEAMKNNAEAAEAKHRNYLMNQSIEKIIRSTVKFRDDIPSDGLDLIIQGKINALRNRYHITNNNGEFKLFNLEDPTQVETDPKTGHALKFQEVLMSQFGEEYIAKKQPQNPPGGGGGRQPISGSGGDNKSPGHVKDWKARMEADMKA